MHNTVKQCVGDFEYGRAANVQNGLKYIYIIILSIANECKLRVSKSVADGLISSHRNWMMTDIQGHTKHRLLSI